MARDRFADMLINPNLRGFESAAPPRQAVQLRQPSRMSMNALAALAVAALVLAIALASFQSSRRQAAQGRALEGQLAAANQSLKSVEMRLNGAEKEIASLRSQLEIKMAHAGSVMGTKRTQPR